MIGLWLAKLQIEDYFANDDQPEWLVDPKGF